MSTSLLNSFKDIIQQRNALSSKNCFVENGIIKEEIDFSDGQLKSVPTYDFLWNHEAASDEDDNLIHTNRFVRDNYPDIGRDVLDLLPNSAWVLDAGCGRGYMGFSLLKDHFKNIRYVGVDASDAIEKALVFFQRRGINQSVFWQADFNSKMIPENFFDLVISIGAIHHTENMWLSLFNLTSKVKKGGKIILWVYRQQQPVRRLSDEYIRKTIRDLSPSDTFDTLLPLSKLGAHLSNLNVTLDIPEDIPLLGVKAGPVDLQRFIHLHLVRMFYSEDLSLERNNWQNLDWFRPYYAHETTIDELEKFCHGHELEIVKSNMIPDGTGIALTLLRTS
ncbi:MAG: methyltransferase domain-containing protein [Chloroflexi bacterium]|nr:methyltransferase domain-containing protein [Chloroflexota bacterium]